MIRARVQEWLWGVVHGAQQGMQRRVDFGGEHRFVDRGTGAEQLVVILAGYKPYLWPFTLERIERAMPAGVDVCLASSAVEAPELDALCDRRGWSRLVTRDNSVALAQNLAIRHHPLARYVHKLDEDVVIGPGYFEAMLDGYRRVARDGRFTPGFCSPLLNVNGFSYRLFLDALGLADEYRATFGELRQASVGVRAHHDGQAARWLWERTLPFDAVAARVREGGFAYSTVPQRFSIGAIVMERDLWQAMRGFAVNPYHDRGGTGEDEIQICETCTTLSRAMVVLHHVLAGHVSFGPQEAAMRAALPELAPGLAPT